MANLERSLQRLTERGPERDADALIRRLELQLTGDIGLYDATADRRLGIFRGGRRGPLVAAAVFAAVLAVLVPALLFLGGRGESPTSVPPPTETPTTVSEPATTLPGEPPDTVVSVPPVVLPESLPDLESWSWQSAEGDETSIPDGVIVSGYGTYFAVEEDVWWQSSDGLTWERGTPPPELGGGDLQLAAVGDEAWVIASRDGSASLSRMKDGTWRPIELAGPPVEIFVPSRRGDTIVVPGRTGAGPVVWVSTDDGAGFDLAPVDWATPALITLGSNGSGWIALVDRDSPEIWASADGLTWSSTGPVPFANDTVYATFVDGTGPFAANVCRQIPGEDIDELWISMDGLTWSAPPQLQEPLSVTDTCTGTLFVTEFGLAFVAFFGGPGYVPQSPDEAILTYLSADGTAWLDVSDASIFYPTEGGPGNVRWSVTNDGVVFVQVSLGSGERRLWTGGFRDAATLEAETGG